MTEAHAPIPGEVVELTAVQPSAETMREEARGRIGNTALQSTIPTGIVVIGTWLLALFAVDLDPGPGTDMPAVVAAAFSNLITVLIAWRMNRKALTAVQTEVVELRQFVNELRQLGDVAA